MKIKRRLVILVPPYLAPERAKRHADLEFATTDDIAGQQHLAAEETVNRSVADAWNDYNEISLLKSLSNNRFHRQNAEAQLLVSFHACLSLG